VNHAEYTCGSRKPPSAFTFSDLAADSPSARSSAKPARMDFWEGTGDHSRTIQTVNDKDQHRPSRHWILDTVEDKP